MADNETNTDLANAEILWKSADALRGQIDAAEDATQLVLRQAELSTEHSAR